MEPMNFVVLAQQGESFADGVITTLISSEVGCQFFLLCWTVLLSNNALLRENDCLSPLHNAGGYLSLFLEFVL
jgi:hypothetical protein